MVVATLVLGQGLQYPLQEEIELFIILLALLRMVTDRVLQETKYWKNRESKNKNRRDS